MSNPPPPFISMCMQQPDGQELATSERNAVLEQMQRNGTIIAARWFRHIGALRPDVGAIPAWQWLLLVQISRRAEAGAIEKALREWWASRHGNVMSSDILEASPRSYHPRPAESLLRQCHPIVYSIEYIQVNPQLRFLEEYRDGMRMHSGPAMQMVCEAGAVYQFIALETLERCWAAENMPQWNQVHLAGVVIRQPQSAPDSILVQHALTEMPRVLEHFDHALRRVSSDGKGYSEIFARLAGYRHHPRNSLAVELPESRIGPLY